ncbi:MAG: hypothetical protein QOF14_1799 [Hyphomicrobiales bacterium]|jgi:hypothetical protein|nr:hypothetical protein [Hyphomicrobiales bacterium]
MKRTLLISVAAVALAAGSTVALSQGSGGGAGAAGGTPMANPSAPSGGQETTTPGTKGKAAQERLPAEKQQKSTQAPQGGQAPATQQSQEEKSAPSTRQSQGEQPTKSQQQTQSPSTGGAKQGTSSPTTDTKTGQQGAGGRPMASSNVSLTTEQKTTIRQTVLTSSAPRVTNVNFDIKVGTAVPRTVRIAPLPVTLIEIQPAWRGYMYFVYNDEIIVVEPGTLRIVAVLEV